MPSYVPPAEAKLNNLANVFTGRNYFVYDFGGPGLASLNFAPSTSGQLWGVSWYDSAFSIEKGRWTADPDGSGVMEFTWLNGFSVVANDIYFTTTTFHCDATSFALTGTMTTGNVPAARLTSGTIAIARSWAYTGGDVTGTAGSAILTIGNGIVTNAKLATMAANTVKVNATTGTAAPTDLALAVSTFPARASTGNIAAKAITDNALLLAADTNVPRLGIANTWALTQTFTLAPVFTDGVNTRIALGLAIGVNVQAYDAAIQKTLGRVVADTTVANTVTKTVVYTQSIAVADISGYALALSVGGTYFNSSGGAVTLTFEIVLDGTIIHTSSAISIATAGTAGSRTRNWWLTLDMTSRSTTLQHWMAGLSISAASPTPPDGDIGTAALIYGNVHTTSAVNTASGSKVLEVKITHGTAATTVSLTATNGVLTRQ